MTSNGATLCVIDDDADIREMLGEVLTFEGYRVILATDGESALKSLHASAQPCCLILLDLMMPRMNGWEFRRRQIQDPALASIPVLLLTGAVDSAKAAEELAVARVIVKPVDLETLLAHIAALC